VWPIVDENKDNCIIPQVPMGGLRVVTVCDEKNIPRIPIRGCVVIVAGQKTTGAFHQTEVLLPSVLLLPITYVQ
jgi:hypothetical protein